MIRTLIAEDDDNLRKVLSNELTEAGYFVTGKNSGAQAFDTLEKEEYDVLLLDLFTPGPGGMEILKKIKTLEIPVEVIVLTGHGTVATAVEAMKVGAYDFLTKPFKIDKLKAVIDKAYEKKSLLRENLLLKTQIRRQAGTPEIITNTPLMFDILKTVQKVAASDLPILVYGESGVGKELIANAIHSVSAGAERPFVPINCGAMPEHILESELFGHEKGAFTGAHERKPGLLEIANNGTAFIDEVGELLPRLQVKLLRVIETKVFYRVGGTREIKVNLRFISATNKDLKAEVEQGTFRSDFYYRISALSVHVPPLRERKEDIPLLVEHLIAHNPSFKNRRFGKEAYRILAEYSWPGNVRELQNLVYRVLLLSEHDVIEPSDLPPHLTSGRRTHTGKLKDVEREYILKVLKEAGGQRGRAAEILGLDSKTLYRKLQSYGVKE